jgi:prenylcysteine oxidase / farnesylcysteine lyase
MKQILPFLLAALSILPLGTADSPDPAQQPIQPLTSNVPSTARSHRVAVIGAGAGGSSTAYHLHQFAANSSIPLDITIFESSPLIGGRTTTVNALDDPRYPTELGASIFASVNHILVNAAAEFGLNSLQHDANRPKATKYEIGIWDGREFVFKSTNDDLNWTDMIKLFWRYGLAPLKTQRLMKSTVARFLKLYEEPLFPWKSLTEAALLVGLLDVTVVPGKHFLKSNGIGERFGREIIQASTRVNYGQNLGLIHGLETMVCMATDGASAIEGGNWRIFEGMVERSHAEVSFNTSVEEIIRLEDGGYKLKASTTLGTAEQGVAKTDIFDTVILAAPLQFSGLKISPPLPNSPDEIPYVTLYVTLLTSPHRLSPKFFSTDTSPPPDQDHDAIPEMVLTTLPPNLDPDLSSSPRGVGPTNFWSVSTLRHVEVNGSTQYLYKIFSPNPLDGTFLSQLLDFPHNPAEEDDDTVQAISRADVSWSHEKKWHSYPYEYPRVTFEALDLDSAGLWYTSGIESFISTMETSALMGKNVARLVVDGLVGGEGEGEGWEKERGEG